MSVRFITPDFTPLHLSKDRIRLYANSWLQDKKLYVIKKQEDSAEGNISVLCTNSNLPHPNDFF